jgi:hypothetical protein
MGGSAQRTTVKFCDSGGQDYGCKNDCGGHGFNGKECAGKGKDPLVTPDGQNQGNL